MALMLLVLALPVPAGTETQPFTDVPGRTFHPLPLAKVVTSPYPRAEVCGPVVYVRQQRDGDWHVTLDDGTAKVVLEIIPELPLPVPKKGQMIRARGVVRTDGHHKWAELHPVLAWRAVTRCRR